MNWIHVAQDKVKSWEHSNKPMDPIKDRTFLEQLSKYQFLKNNPDPWS
jgi:hypothetical protein